MNWVFGYGSLIWRVDFPYHERRTATVAGWARRFWQGSHDHRGTPDAPGRVVTLIPALDNRLTGIAYAIDDQTFTHLDYREKNGYERIPVTMQTANGSIEGVTYIATADNEAFLGPASTEEIARHIVASRGPSGTNVDYLFGLVDALHELGEEDDHVVELAERCRVILSR